jgi:hypothetical protein
MVWNIQITVYLDIHPSITGKCVDRNVAQSQLCHLFLAGSEKECLNPPSIVVQPMKGLAFSNASGDGAVPAVRGRASLSCNVE